ncbi:hypothetical protein ACQKM2_20395 [Streptomyces sp. NPDC004126]
MILGLAPGADEQYFADAARALAAGMTFAGREQASPEGGRASFQEA